ncbi:SRPBCC domain-containing protein [Marimonas sp. MJW-29]|uniref:SRPBCC domain-containing protein n=1 Tax=Sulfitobacter sediminis TaxID=3234186 RepID=A0ABV3RHB8_9RHOB
MSDIHLEREFAVTPERLFDVVSTRAELIRWWGHDGWTFTDENIDFSRTGPWFADMRSEEGNRYKLSGQVTLVNRPRSIGFTWAWHDDEDKRGPESHVTFTISETGVGAKLEVDHRELASDDIAAQHARGWAGPLGRLSRLLSDERKP